MLDELAAFGPFFAVGSHPPAAAPTAPWRQASELTTPDGPLRDRVASVSATLAARGGTDAPAQVEPRVAASAVHLGLIARLVSPGLGAAVLRGRPDLRPAGLWWQDVAGGPVPLSVPAPCEGQPGGGANAGEWDRVLLDETVAPVTAAIARLVPMSGRVLWGNVASAVNAAAAQVARQRPDLARAAWQAAGRLFASPLLHGEPHPPGPGFRRSSCCLFYRLAPGNPTAVCGDCVLARRTATYKRLSRLAPQHPHVVIDHRPLPRHQRPQPLLPRVPPPLRPRQTGLPPPVACRSLASGPCGVLTQWMCVWCRHNDTKRTSIPTDGRLPAAL